MSSESAQPSAPRISVVIGTLNRCGYLKHAIDSLLSQDIPAETFEVVVVDNGSTDETMEFLSGVSDRAPHVRWCREDRLGLSIARNRGIVESRSELVAFMDDNAVADPSWLRRLIAMFDAFPDIDAGGGRIDLAWPQGRPSWMPESCEGYFARCYYGDSPRYLQAPEFPYGSNMVIRKSALKRIDGFNENVGPKGDNMMSAGEQDLFIRLYALPIHVAYEPSAVVTKAVLGARVSRRWMLKRAMRYGKSKTRAVKNTQPVSFTEALNQVARATANTLIGLVSVTRGFVGRQESAVVVSRMAVTAYWIGSLTGWLGLLLGYIAPVPPNPPQNGARLS